MYKKTDVLHLTKVDKIVRDHLYDETQPGTARAKAGITVNEMLDEIDRIRGSHTDAGAIRRSLTKIEQAGLCTSKKTGQGRTLAYTWTPGYEPGYDYQHRELPPAQTQVMPVSTDADAQRRANLDKKIEQRWNDLQGTVAPWSTIPTTKQKPAQRPAPKPFQKKATPILRPNGEQYLPRELAGTSDVQTLRKLRDSGLFVMLYGAPGGGKTALLEAAFADDQRGMYTLTGDEETKVDDFTGQWYPTGNPNDPYYWADGPLTLALKNGGVLFIDDATLINPKAIACVYPLMDGRGVLQVKQHLVERNGIMQPELVEAKEGFYIVAAHNPGVQGAILSEALASRFRVHIEVESDLDMAGQLGVNPKFIKLAKNMRTRRNNGEFGVFVPEMRELLAARDMAKAFGEKAAVENLLGMAPEDTQDDLAKEMKTLFGYPIAPKRLQLRGQL